MDELLNQVDKEMPVPSASSQRDPSSSQNTSRNCEEVTDSNLGGNASPEKKAAEQTAFQKKKIEVCLEMDEKNIASNDGRSLFDAIKSITVEIDKQQGKMMLVLGEEGYVNLGLPLQCVPEGSCFEIKFVQSEGHKSECLRQYDHRDGECIKSYVFATAKTTKTVVKCPTLRCKLCVYALDEDGKWHLIENGTNVLENNLPGDDLDDRCFQVEVYGSTSASAASQSSELEQRERFVLEREVLNLYYSFTNEDQVIKKILNQEKKEKGKEISTLLNGHKKNFEQLCQEPTPIEVHKLLGHLHKSVGYISWKSNGISQGATCFVLRDNYILTCCHIVNLIVGVGIEPDMWAKEISNRAQVTFLDGDSDSDSDKKWSIDSWFEVFDKTLNYAVLRLKESDIPIPEGLLDHFSSPPSKGPLYIIGHLGEQKKVSVLCYMIPQPHQEQKSQGHVQATGKKGLAADTHEMNRIHMFTPRSFQEVDSKDILSSRYSGSPIFNEDLKLVAIAAACFSHESRKKHYIIEFGSFLEVILNNISQQHKTKNKSLTVGQENIKTAHEE
ncbi:serine protease FAM111A-like [Petaurus breviceps papuanus]|uniref:serine protease FAM111A-like n=1 Tax=Petaurus breviceps papuanus TaxID=3040969 RepID=UPI0036DCFC27